MVRIRQRAAKKGPTIITSTTSRSKLSRNQVFSALDTLGGEVDEGMLRAFILEHADSWQDQLMPFLTKIIEQGGIEDMISRTHEPVSVDEFIDSDEFCNMGSEVYPEVRRMIKEVVDGGYVEAILTGAIGIGKTTGAQLINAYDLYKLSLEKQPQLKYGLMPQSSIVFAMMNRTDTLAAKVTYGEFKHLIDRIAYFKEYFRYNRYVNSELRFPNNIRVMHSYAGGGPVLGMNVIGAIIDEINFMLQIEKSKRSADGGQFNQAENAYGNLVRRRKSRFLKRGKLPGCLCVVSSKGHPKDFTELRIQEIELEEERSSYVWNKAHWEVVPPDKWISAGTFRVDCGDNRTNPRILGPLEKAREGAKIIEVPDDLHRDFVRDMESSLRDWAGIATSADKSYIWDRQKIWAMADKFEKQIKQTPFDVIETDLVDGLPPLVDGYTVPDPDRFRVVHIDLGLVNDAAGIACGYVKDLVTVRRLNPADGKMIVDQLPNVVYDFVLRVVPPSNGEIEFSEIRELIYYLRDVVGIPIQVVTNDGWQSVDNRQILKRAGFRVGYQSVEQIIAYRPMRDAIFQGRVLCPEHDVAFEELGSVQRMPNGKNIDHPAGKSKDCADAMVGVMNTLLTLRKSWLQSKVTGNIDEKDIAPSSKHRLQALINNVAPVGGREGVVKERWRDQKARERAVLGRAPSQMENLLNMRSAPSKPRPTR